MMDTKEKVSVEKITEQAKRWRGKWLILCDWTSSQGTAHKAGNIFWGKRLYLSRDTADSAAERWLKAYGASHLTEYLGAYPIEVTP